MPLGNFGQYGGSLGLYHRGANWQQGGGLFSVFKSFLPMLKSASKGLAKVASKGIQQASKSETLKSIGSNLKDAAVSGAVDVGLDLLRGVDPREKLQSNVQNTQNMITGAIEDKLESLRPKETALERKKVPKKKAKRKNVSYHVKSKKPKEAFDLYE